MAGNYYVWNTLPDQQPSYTAGAHNDVKASLTMLFSL